MLYNMILQVLKAETPIFLGLSLDCGWICFTKSPKRTARYQDVCEAFLL